MTVTAILLNFRAALLALASIAERVGIAWKRPDAYDEWDTIAGTLFDKLVVDVLRWSLPETSQKHFRLPLYDSLLPTYGDLGTVEVVHPSLPLGRWLFHAFGTGSEPFDVIEVRLISDDGVPLSKALETCRIDGAEFLLRLGPRAGVIEKIEMTDD